jgi:hypothetical protein
MMFRKLKKKPGGISAEGMSDVRSTVFIFLASGIAQFFITFECTTHCTWRYLPSDI